MPNPKLEKLKEKLLKEHGPKSVMFASEIPPYEVVSSGSLALDYITGIGGFPTNRVLEICGGEGSGKSTLALHAVNNFLKQYPDKSALYIDIENRLSEEWVKNFVEDSDRVLIVKPDTMEDATDVFTDCIKTELFCIAVLDSIGGAASQRVVNKSATVGDVGGNALAVSRFAKFAQTFSGKYGVCVIGINQIRDDMDGYHRLITPGGKAWKHATSLRIELQKNTKDRVTDVINGEELVVGYLVKAKIHKNSLGAPYRTCQYWFHNVKSKYGFGVDQVQELSALALLTGVVNQVASGSYVHPSFPGDDHKIRGKDNAIAYLKEHPDSFAAVKEDVLVKLKGTVVGIGGTFDADTEEDLTTPTTEFVW